MCEEEKLSHSWRAMEEAAYEDPFDCELLYFSVAAAIVLCREDGEY